MKKVKAINVSTQYVMEMHNVNGNEDGSPKNVNGNTYVSGQKIRYMLMETIREENSNKNVIVSTSDGVVCDIASDLRSDLIGYMNTEEANYASKRNSPIQVSFAVSKNESDFFDDLFVRFKTNPSETNQNKQRINNKTYSVKDVINFDYKLDCISLSSSEYFKFDKEKFVERFYIKHVDENERKRRAELFIKGTSYLSGLANQSRNAVINTPVKVFISLDSKNTFKKYFDMSEDEQKSLLQDLDKRNVPYFIGGIDGVSVSEAYERAYDKLKELELEDYSNEILTQEEVKEKYSEILSLQDIETNRQKKDSKKNKSESVN